MVRIAIVWLILSQAVVQAQPGSEAVALLPLDSDQRLELYGQPVASEIARALVAGGIEVVVVGPKMAVPTRARLVVDGKITAGKGDAVTLSIRVRDPRDGTVVDTLSATATALTSIDRAAEELSARVLPSVKAHLAELDHPKIAPSDDKPQLAPVPPPAPPKLIAVATGKETTAAVLRAALDGTLDGWTHAHHRERQPTDPQSTVTRKTVLDSKAESAVVFDVIEFAIEPGPVPMARARVHIRAIDATHVAFDRVVVTDTIVGDRGISDADLAARTAREVLAIVEPHLRHAIANWR